MNKQQEALKLALEALEHGLVNTTPVLNYDGRIISKAITAIREALAEQPSKYDCCANCMRPQHEHNGNACPKPYTTVWHAWDYDFSPYPAPEVKPAQQQEYEQANPLGGPAKVFDAMADAIRAGDDYHAVLHQYGYAEAQQQEPNK